MYQESTLIDLVKLIYDAAADSARWPAFLGRYQEILAARNIALGYTSPDLSQSLFLATGVDMSDMERYHRYPCPWLDRLLMANWRDGGADASHHLISDSELRSTDCFNEFLGPRQFHYGMGAAIPATQEGPAVLVILRENHKGPYSDEDLHFLRTLLPHMSSAFNATSTCPR
ncbi:MAG: hypothetical protein R2762_20770 [Bryobacteraceae bacterium]